MKQFFKFMFASMLGFVLSIGVIFFLFIAMIAGIAASAGDEQSVELKDNSVLHMKMDFNIEERTEKNPFAEINFGGDDNSEVGLNDILANIEKAKDDDKIKGIFLQLSMISAGYSSLEEIRNALIDYKKSGKFLIAYAELYTKGNYYLASVADKVYLNPSGDMLFNGVYADLVFFKGALDKLGIEAQVIKHGKFKSAAESLVQDKLGDENRKQIEAYVGSIYYHYIGNIAKARKKSAQEVLEIADQLKVQVAPDAVKVGLVDALRFEDEVLDEIRKKIGVEKDEKINLVTLGKYKNAKGKEKKSGKNKIAVIYAVGDINSGEGDNDRIGSETMVEAIRKARKDEDVKAIVLRVNSPGGSALASDVIWREAVLAQKEKPFIVSMGDVAASGGYYISIAADTIVAQPNTITGSIGVIGVLMNSQKLLNDKLGITIDGVKFGKYSDLGRIDRPLNPDEEAIIQHAVDYIYDDFISKVAQGRNMSKASIDSIGQGRVWSGIDAKRIGLVDVLGGLNDAINIAAKKAKLEEYRVISLPEMKGPFEMLAKHFGDEASMFFMKRELGENFHYYQKLQSAVKRSGIQARLEYDIVLK